MGEGLKFVVDSMHGTLARKLRIFGFDTVHDQLSDDTLLEIGRRERRVIVTSDRDLHRTAQKNGLNSVLLECENDEDRIFTLFKRLHVKVENLGPEISRCPLCNGALENVSGSSIKEHIPEKVREYYDSFYSCISCGKIYWEGGHWRKIRVFASRIGRRLEQDCPNST